MKNLALLLLAMVIPSVTFGAERLQDPWEVCALLSNGPKSQKQNSAYVAFGMRSADYFFAGLAEVVVDKDGNPVPDNGNHVVIDFQSTRELTAETAIYAIPDLSSFEFGKEAGMVRFDLEVQKGFEGIWPNAPVNKLESQISKVFPISTCLNGDQKDWTKWRTF